ncbi:cytochrome P450 [Embleya sp. AB8]|uniref:cytochrome P450 n=1 Tax=Embleya sp. AB8 TaxID=3156304 RepID=UPI003C79367C
MTYTQPAAQRPELAPGAWPVLGHLPAFGRDPLKFLGTLPAHGDLVEIRFPQRRMYVACHPDVAQKAFADGLTFDRTGPIYDAMRADMGNGLATCVHAEHRRQRRMVQPAFRRDRMERYAALMCAEIDTLARSWRPGQVVDLVDEMFTLTTSVAVRTLFAAGMDARTAVELRRCLDVFLRGTVTRVLLPAATRLPTPANRRYERAVAQWRGYVRQIVAEGRQRDGAGEDLLSWLIEARDDDRTGLTEQELSDQIMVLVLAGAETTSASLAWALHLLGTHPEVEAELFAEADTVLAGATATLAELPRLEHTGRVVKETLRLYPPAWALIRTATRDTELAGRQLAAGGTVLVSPYLLHRRADLFDAPDEFRPERWEVDAQTGRCPIPPATFVPFGVGPNRCVGDTFALTMASLTLASLATRWRLRPIPGTTIRAAARAVLSPRTLPMEVIARR